MSRWLSVVGTIFGVLLWGCSTPTPAVPPTAMPTKAEETANLSQSLPISAQVVIAGRTIGLEVARTPQQQATGLMYRTSLPDNRGMLFPFAAPQPTSFWMKNTLIPLDMIFLRSGKVQAIAPSVPPCRQEPCPSYGPKTPVDQVIELRGGRAAELNLQVGDRLDIVFLDAQRR